jgi:2-desacetyl-2-hydroxyethyl bacteriochlorophyllide A dehydrogenase
MKTLVCLEPGSFSYEERDMPISKEEYAIIRIKRIGICGTDLHAYEGTQPYFEYPRILGHELSGELVETGGAAGFEVGDAVSFIPYFNCGTCIACRNGTPNCCSSIKVFGVHIDGGFADYVSVPTYSLLKSGGLGYDELCLVEPFSIGAHAVRRAEIKQGEYALVVGAGPIGLGIAEFARIAGANVIVMDVNEDRLSFCANKLNLPFTINPKKTNAFEALKKITSGDMPTLVFDATGNLNAINNSFQFIAHGARYILVGLQKGEISFSHPEFHKREATLMSSRNATRIDFEHVINSISTGMINPLNYITHRVSFNDVKDQFASWLNPETGVIKAVVEM